MRTCCCRLAVRGPFLVLALLLSGAAPLDEANVAVNVHGNVIQVKVVRDDGSPVAGYPIRLLDSQHKILTEGQSNAQGLWEQFMARAGTYEIVGADRKLGHPVQVFEDATTLPPTGVLPCCRTVAAPLASPSPWLLWSVVGGVSALIGGLGLVVWLRRRHGDTLREAALPVRGPSRGQLVFVGLMFAAGLGLVGWSMVHATKEPAPSDVAEGARVYLRKRGVQPLSGSLVKLLTQPGHLVRSENMAPVGDTAPPIELTEVHGRPWNLEEQLDKGPVVVVFYFGYGCDHCVSQLFALQQDIRYFRELNAEVVAISNDPAAETLKQYKKFGAFDFPVLSDPGNQAAAAYGVYTPSDSTKEGQQLHGTFLIDRQGIVQWGNSGPEPFTDNRTLLYKLAKMEDRLPAK